MKITQLKLFLYSIFYVAPFVDALNGFLVFNKLIGEGSLMSPGQLFRLFVTVLSFFLLKEKQFYIILFSFFLIFSLEFISFNSHLNVKGFTLGVVYAYKLIFILLLYLVLINALERIKLIKVISFFRNSALLYVFILFGSVLLGMDKSTYASGTFGSKGLFASGNGLSIFLGSASLIAYYYYRGVPNKKNLYSFFIILVGTILVGTKASIFFLFICLILMFIYSTLKVKIILSILGMFVFLYQYNNIIESFTTVFDVIVYRYNASDSLVSFLASNRDNYISEAFVNYNLEGMKSLRLFFGAGVFVSFRDFTDPNLIYDTLENDFFDIFFSFGLLGILLYISFILKGFYEIIKKFNWILFFSWFAITFYSLIAGHVLFNAMSSLALILIYSIITNKESVESI